MIRLYIFLVIQFLILSFASGHPYSNTTFENPPTQELRPNVLFVGNSLTFWSGGLPESLTDLASALKLKASFQEHTIGGRSFYQYVDSSDLEAVLKMGLWDFVVLQGNSVEAVPEDNKFKSFEPSIKTINEKIKKYNPECKVLLFSTVFPKPDIDRSMEVYLNYKKAAQSIGAIVVPVGPAWLKISGKTPEAADFLFSDKKHPSAYGKMLNTYLFYGAIFNKYPEEINVPTPTHGNKKMDDTILTNLKTIAQQTLIENGILQSK